MKEHGVTPEKLYPSMDNEPEKIYPFISIPAEAFDKDYQPGHECTLKIVVKIEVMSEHHFECKLLKSEETE